MDVLDFRCALIHSLCDGFTCRKPTGRPPAVTHCPDIVGGLGLEGLGGAEKLTLLVLSVLFVSVKLRVSTCTIDTDIVQLSLFHVVLALPRSLSFVYRTFSVQYLYPPFAITG